MSPSYISLSLVIGITSLSIWNIFHLKRRRARQLALEKFRDDFTTDLSVELSEAVVKIDHVIEKLKKYPQTTTDDGAQVLIDYHNYITGSERQMVSEIFFRLGHLRKAISESMSKNEEKRLRSLTYLLYLKVTGTEVIFLRNVEDKNPLIRLISLAGLSLTSDLPLILQVLHKMENNFDGKMDAAVSIMMTIGRRFGLSPLLEISRSLELDNRLRRAAIFALVELKPYEHMTELNYILNYFGILTPVEISNIQNKLKDFFVALDEIA